MSVFDLQVHSTSELPQISTNSKSRFTLPEVNKAKNIKHKVERGISVTLNSKFRSYVGSTSKRHRNDIETKSKEDLSSIIWR